MKNFWLDLLSLVCRVLGMAVMFVAYVVISVAGWIEWLTEWADVQRGIPIVQVGEDVLIESEKEHVGLLQLVDLVWQTATDSKEVPSTKWAEELIARWRAGERSW
jgi:hypothetical protein